MLFRMKVQSIVQVQGFNDNDNNLRPPKAPTSFKELLNKILGNHYLSLESQYPSITGYCYGKKNDKKKRCLTASYQLLWKS